MVLTDGPSMVLTPTYYVYRLYTVHHDATLLPIDLVCGSYKFEDEEVPAVNVSASRDAAGKIHVSLCNIDPDAAVRVEAKLQGADSKRITGQILTADTITAHNTFKNPGVVEPASFQDVSVTDSGFVAEVPAKSIVVLTVE